MQQSEAAAAVATALEPSEASQNEMDSTDAVPITSTTENQQQPVEPPKAPGQIKKKKQTVVNLNLVHQAMIPNIKTRVVSDSFPINYSVLQPIDQDHCNDIHILAYGNLMKRRMLDKLHTFFNSNLIQYMFYGLKCFENGESYTVLLIVKGTNHSSFYEDIDIQAQIDMMTLYFDGFTIKHECSSSDSLESIEANIIIKLNKAIFLEEESAQNRYDINNEAVEDSECTEYLLNENEMKAATNLEQAINYYQDSLLHEHLGIDNPHTEYTVPLHVLQAMQETNEADNTNETTSRCEITEITDEEDDEKLQQVTEDMMLHTANLQLENQLKKQQLRDKINAKKQQNLAKNQPE